MNVNCIFLAHTAKHFIQLLISHRIFNDLNLNFSTIICLYFHGSSVRFVKFCQNKKKPIVISKKARQKIFERFKGTLIFHEYAVYF